MDRVTRSVKDLGFLIEKYFNQYALISVSEQVDTRYASGRLVLNVLMSVAQWERETIGERTKDALSHKKQNGEKTGGDVPFGKMISDDGKTLIDNVEEQKVITLIHKYKSNGMSLRKIANGLKDQGITNRKGNPIHFTQIPRFINNAA